MDVQNTRALLVSRAATYTSRSSMQHVRQYPLSTTTYISYHNVVSMLDALVVSFRRSYTSSDNVVSILDTLSGVGRNNYCNYCCDISAFIPHDYASTENRYIMGY